MKERTRDAQGQRLSKQLCLRFVMRHPVAFREFFIPRMSKRRYWQRYTFVPAMLALGTGDIVVKAGRASGKSYALLEPELVRQAIARPGEETLLTAFRRTHVTDRIERAIDYFETIPLFRLFLKRVLRSPIYHVALYNGHSLYGVSVGDDVEARMAQGKHASTVVIEEAQQYPIRAYGKLMGAQDPRGSWKLMIGVPDGRVDTPFKNADRIYTSFQGRRFALSRRLDPYFDQRAKADLADALGGEASDFFQQEVDAKWGNPAYSAWNIDQIFACMEAENSLPLVTLTIDGRVYRQLEMVPEAACNALPGPKYEGGQVRMSADIGYSQPTEIGIHEFFAARWWMTARVTLVNRMEHDEQAAIIAYLGERYGAEQIGIDTTDGEGRAIAKTLEDLPRWAPYMLGGGCITPIVRVSFNEGAVYDYRRNEDGEREELKDTMKHIAVRVLRGMIARREVAWPRDEKLAAEFNQERETKTLDGMTKLLVPFTCHIPEMLRVFSAMIFRADPPSPPEEDLPQDLVLPEWGGAGLWREMANA